MNGMNRNWELRSQAGIRQAYSNKTMLVEQLEHMGVIQSDVICDKIVFSEAFFLFAALIFIFSMLAILTILYFWGGVFFVRDRAAKTNNRRSRERKRESTEK